MKYFFIFILCLNQNCQAMDDSITLKDLRNEFFKKVSYKVETTSDLPYFSVNDEIIPISVLPISQIIPQNRLLNFKNDVWYLKYIDHYLEASYLWYNKLKEKKEFTFLNLREFYWCLISSNNYTNIVDFAEKMLFKLKEIEGINPHTSSVKKPIIKCRN